MNTIQVVHGELNGGEKTMLYSPLGEKEFQVQFHEIFEEGHYKSGRIKRDMNILDVGGNCGLASLYLKDWAKKIVAFEPNFFHFEALRQNIAPYSHLRAINKAVLYADGMEFMSSGTSPFAESFMATGGVKQLVSCITMEQALKEAEMDHVDLLKIDIEGSEYGLFVSESFEKCVPKIDHIVGELHFEQKMVPELGIGLLEKYGYEVKVIPSKNIFLGVYLDLADGTRDRSFEKHFDTIFFAKRK